MNANKLKLTFLLLISLLPIVAATIYFRASLEGGIGTRSRGTLILPVLDLPALGLRNRQGEPAYLSFEEMTAGVSPDDYKPRPWQLIFITGTSCDQACLDRLYLLRQIHLRLAREADRVQRAVVVVDAEIRELPAVTQAFLLEQQPDLQLLNADPAVLLPQLLPSAGGRDPVSEHFIYVADPVGNIMLYFAPENTAEDIFGDIDKLLDQSSLG
jgi:hypothetical protein